MNSNNNRPPKGKVVVLAPRFPSINQPWVDTYLEQLINRGLDPLIISLNRSYQSYGKKVDLLGLLDKTMFIEFGKRSMIRSILKNIIDYKTIISTFKSAWSNGQSVREILSAFLLSLVVHDLIRKIRGISIIHSHSESMAYAFSFYAKSEKVPLLLTFHGLPPKGVPQISARKRKILYSNVNKVLVNTKFSKGQVCSLGCDPEKVIIIPQGLSLEEFKFSKKLAPKDEKMIKVLTVGRYHRDKGQGYALLALRRLLDNGVNIHWTFVGVGPDQSRLIRLSKNLGIEKSATFLSNVNSDDLKRVYRDHSIFVLPSIDAGYGHVETQGVVILEAQASGCVVIASQVGGIPECLGNEDGGFLVRQKSSRGIKDIIMDLVKLDQNRWDFLQLASRKNVEDKYDANMIGDRVCSLISEVSKKEIKNVHK